MLKVLTCWRWELSALAAVLGVTLGALAPGAIWLWLGLALALGVLAWVWKPVRPAALLLALGWAFAGWAAGQAGWTTHDDIRQFTTETSQLARVEGVVVGAVYLSPSRRGAFGAFAYRAPNTLFELECQRIEVDGQWRPARGRLLVKIEQVDVQLRSGERVRASGWLAAIDGPSNPGEHDYRAWLAQQGVYGRLTLKSRDNLARLGLAGAGGAWQRLRQGTAQAASGSLALGMRDKPTRLHLLQTLLLGRRDVPLDGLEESFRRTGLAHLLAISGGHLAILLGLVWLAARLVIHHPPRAALLVLAVLALYLLAVPAQVPIMRAGIMAALLCLAGLTGWRVPSLRLLAIAVLVTLVWRPLDLFNAGYQLSFLVVAALLLFTRRVGQWLWRDPEIALPDQWREQVLRAGADYAAANLVACAAALPLVALHFAAVTPVAGLLSLLALPVVTAVLGLGYAKIALGLLSPSAGALLSYPLTWVTDALRLLVEQASTWPGVYWELARAPSALWALGALGWSAALLGGWFHRRPAALLLSALLVTGWFWWGTRPPGLGHDWQHSEMLLPASTTPARAAPVAAAPRPVMELHMLAVGNGSCFLVRTASGKTLLFDCGSQEYLDTGVKSVTPALRSLGVQHLDLVLISHADLDHYGGVLDVLDRVPAERVMVNEYLLAEARNQPQGATAFLIEQLYARQLAVEQVGRGLNWNWDDLQCDLLWPPPGLAADTPANDTSLVLRLRTAGHCVLLTGDIQQFAITQLLQAEPDLRADVMDLAHHGSFVDASPRWLAQVAPKLVLQSSGEARLYRDRWFTLLSEANIKRLITARDGMASVWLADDGAVRCRTFRAPASLTPAPAGGEE